MMNLTPRDWTFAVFSPENQPLERHFVKLAEKFVRKPFFLGCHERITPGELRTAKGFLQVWFTFILPPEDKLTVDGILELCKAVILRKGLQRDSR